MRKRFELSFAFVLLCPPVLLTTSARSQPHSASPNQLPQLVVQTRQLIGSIAISRNGKLVATGDGGDSSVIKLWDGDTGRQLRTLSGHKLRVTCLAFSPDG